MTTRRDVVIPRNGSVECPTISEGSDADSSTSSSRERGRDRSEISITIDDIDDPPHDVPRGAGVAAALALSTERENDVLPDRVESSTSSSDRYPSGRGAAGLSGFISALWQFTLTGSADSAAAAVDDDDAAEHPPAAQGRRFTAFAPVRRVGASAGVFANRRRSNLLVINSRGGGYLRSSSRWSSASGGNANNNETTAGGGGCCCLADAWIVALRKVIDHKAWRLMILVCILFLLFAPAVYAIWMSMYYPRFVAVILFIALAALVVDIVVRCIVDRSYFSWNRSSWGGFTVGSFKFWFDMVSLCPVIFMILHVLLAGAMKIEVELSEHGLPTMSMNSRSYAGMSIHSPSGIIFTIGNFVLMGRFIRSSTLVQYSSKCKFYYLNPCYWTEKLISYGKHEGNDDVQDVAFRESEKRDTRKLQESAKLEPHPPKRFFSGFKKEEPNDGASSQALSSRSSNLAATLRNSVSTESHSQVGTAMRELTQQRVAIGVLVAVVVTIVLDWREWNTTAISTMVFLHGRTANELFATTAVDIAHSSVIPFLLNYTRANSTGIIFQRTYANCYYNPCPDRHIVEIVIYGQGVNTTGYFDNGQVWVAGAKMQLTFTIFIVMLWVAAETSFGGPVIHLVVEPIERMVRMLSMLMKDPLGYSETSEYKNLVREEDGTANGWYWTKEMIRGMETHFLMSTIQRIGNLLRVGFGSAGAEIIRDNLERVRGRNEDVLFLNKQGGTVSCIFLFCDIRQFTDATESLQEEVFVFTNRIANVVHSICNSYGGSANKNIGDAFLVSWRLDETPIKEDVNDDPSRENSNYKSKGNHADKALLSVVKICMALQYDQYFTDGMSDAAKNKLMTKLSNRNGPLVQMGFGLHAGTAVQGAIGSQRKLDATYIGESVERSEFLESSTKSYGVPILMSDSFYNLLEPANRRRCRKVDQLLILSEEFGNLSDPHEILESGERMSVYTFDMDIDALWRSVPDDEVDISDRGSTVGTGAVQSLRNRRRLSRSSASKSLSSTEARRGLLRSTSNEGRRNLWRRGDIEKAMHEVAAVDQATEKARELVLPNCTHQYTDKSWLEPDIKKIRREYVSNGIIFPKYQEGLKAYYAKDWEHARNCFELVLSQRDDGPSRYFLKLIADHGGVPPKKFIAYNVVRG